MVNTEIRNAIDYATEQHQRMLGRIGPAGAEAILSDSDKTPDATDINAAVVSAYLLEVVKTFARANGCTTAEFDNATLALWGFVMALHRFGEQPDYMDAGC